MSELEPPPDALKDLFAADKQAPTIAVSTRAALRSRLAATVGRAPLGHAAAGAALGGASKALAIVAIALAAGAGTAIAVKHARASRPVIQQPAPPQNTAVVSAPPPVHAHDPAEAAETQKSEHPPLRSSVQPHPRTEDETTELHNASAPSEPDLLKRAWTALSAGEPERALQITEQDAQIHPDGVLAEEREAARIVALARLHRMDEARSAASRFLKEHPESIHRALVERAIHSEETP